MVTIVREFDPHVVVHIAVWEPNARAHPGDAAAWTHTAAVAVLGAAAECPSLQHLTVRSGIAVYGRRRNAATRPDESVPPDPTTPFGRSLLEMEDVAIQAGRAADVPVTALRLAPVIGPHVPSPLGRLLRLPVLHRGTILIPLVPPQLFLPQLLSSQLLLIHARRWLLLVGMPCSCLQGGCGPHPGTCA